MKFEVYCDKANSDVLTSANVRARHLMLSSLSLPEELRNEINFAGMVAGCVLPLAGR